MNQPQNNNGSTDVDSWTAATANNVKLCYGLYLLSFLLSGIPALVGLVFAYMNRGSGNGVLDSHYTFIIRTFWIGLLYGLICTVLAVVGIGFLLMILVAVWAVVRCVKGLQAIANNAPVADPQSWAF